MEICNLNCILFPLLGNGIILWHTGTLLWEIWLSPSSKESD